VCLGLGKQKRSIKSLRSMFSLQSNAETESPKEHTLQHTTRRWNEQKQTAAQHIIIIPSHLPTDTHPHFHNGAPVTLNLNQVAWCLVVAVTHADHTFHKDYSSFTPRDDTCEYISPPSPPGPEHTHALRSKNAVKIFFPARSAPRATGAWQAEVLWSPDAGKDIPLSNFTTHGKNMSTLHPHATTTKRREPWRVSKSQAAKAAAVAFSVFSSQAYYPRIHRGPLY